MEWIFSIVTITIKFHLYFFLRAKKNTISFFFVSFMRNEWFGESNRIESKFWNWIQWKSNALTIWGSKKKGGCVQLNRSSERSKTNKQINKYKSVISVVVYRWFYFNWIVWMWKLEFEIFRQFQYSNEILMMIVARNIERIWRATNNNNNK